MKKLIVMGIVAAALGGGTWWLWGRNAETQPKDAGPKLAQVTRGDIELVIEATGSVESNLDVDIKCKASGEIIALPYDVSDHVPKHEPGKNEDKALLVALDPVDGNHNVQQAQAAVDADTARVTQAQSNLSVAEQAVVTMRMEADAVIASAKAKAAMADLTLQRTQEMFNKDIGTKDEVDNARTAAMVAQADVKTGASKEEAIKGLKFTVELRKADEALARANLASSSVALEDAQQRLTDTKIYSPIDGVVTARSIQVGQIVASGIITVGGGTSLMTVSDLSRIFVVASVDESDIGHLHETGKLGQEVTITADAYPGRRFAGKTIVITPRGSIASNVVTYPVKIEVTGEDKNLLLPKMTANVRILANRRESVLLIPNSAIHYDRDKPFVELWHGGQTERRDVTLGLNDGLQAEVIQGLNEGDQITTGASTMKWSNEGKTTTQRGGEERRDGTPGVR